MAFIDKRDYIVHVSKVHANHRPFACSSCGMAYKTKQGMYIFNCIGGKLKKKKSIAFLKFWPATFLETKVFKIFSTYRPNQSFEITSQWRLYKQHA